VPLCRVPWRAEAQPSVLIACDPFAGVAQSAAPWSMKMALLLRSAAMMWKPASRCNGGDPRFRTTLECHLRVDARARLTHYVKYHIIRHGSKG
jgi:hypothetical protein